MSSRAVIIIDARDQASVVFNQVQNGMKGIDTTAKQASQGTKALSGAFGGLTTMVTGFIGAYVGIHGLQMIQQMAMLGAQVEVTEASFNRMIASVGIGADIMDKMKAAAGGTIPELQLMQALNTSLIGSSAEFGNMMANAYPQLIEIARAANIANPALGDVDFMIRSLSIGLKRMSPRIIDNLGLQLSLGEANQNLAAQLGKSTDALTVEEKQMALLNETLRAGGILVDQVGISTDNTITKTQQWTTAQADLKAEFGRSASDLLLYQGVLAKLAGGVTKLLEGERKGKDMANAYRQELKRLFDTSELTYLQWKEMDRELSKLLQQVSWGVITVDEFTIALSDMSDGVKVAVVDAAALEAKIKELNLVFVDMGEAGFTGGEDLAGTFIDIKKASDAFLERVYALSYSQQLNGIQVIALRDKHNELKQSLADGKISAKEFSMELAIMLGLLPQIADPTIAAMEAILGLSSALDTAKASMANWPRMPEMGDWPYDIQVYPGSTTAIAEEINKAGEDIAATFLSLGVPIEQVETDLQRLKDGTWDLAGEIVGADKWAQDALINSAIDTAFAKSDLLVQESRARESALNKAIADEKSARKKMLDDAERDSKQRIATMKSTISGLLTPTMPDDWWKPKLPRKDEWDEVARQAADVANLGEGSPHYQELMKTVPKFKELVEAMGVKEGALAYVEAFYQFTDLSAIKTDRIKQQYTDLMTAAFNKEQIVNAIAADIQAGGGTVNMDVLGALVAGKPELALMALSGGDLGTAMTGGYNQTVTDARPISMFVDAANNDLEAQRNQLLILGNSLGGVLIAGITQALVSPDFINILAGAVSPRVAEIINAQWGGPR